MPFSWSHLLVEVTLDTTETLNAEIQRANTLAQQGWQCVVFIPNPKDKNLGWLIFKRQE